MKYSHRLSDAIHILAYVKIYHDSDLSSRTIALSVESNPSLVRRLMATLAKAGLLTTHPGTVAPELARPANSITMLDIYHALDDGQLLHIDEKTNPLCIVGGNIQDTLNEAYQKVQAAAENVMTEITLQSIIDDILARQKSKAKNS
ncbi:Rrf2 family transcriptional regulator [Loigolactobacillus binensis]|uniref:Rrf2 family transcriptional regulator n=1 Tax=Loigolactobacillus binensis TaxID=2559922 RepID=A0ABW3EEY6_9LACO|nr:Rrf2 family transcriptional regulator [Loigolactobacillus binensis]